MAKILIVDDEQDIRSLIRRFAEHEGYETTEASSGQQAIELCRLQDFDAVILDIMMPGMDGFATCQKIREIKEIPTLMLSARNAEYDKLLGFELGIEDYVIKPFSPKELMARIRVLVKRRQASAQKTTVWSYEGLSIDTRGRSVMIDQHKVELTAKEYDLLLCFVENQGIALSREQILNAVWGYTYYGDDRTVDWQVKLLRSKLGRYRDWIKTLRGVGYKFEVES